MYLYVIMGILGVLVPAGWATAATTGSCTATACTGVSMVMPSTCPGTSTAKCFRDSNGTIIQFADCSYATCSSGLVKQNVPISQITENCSKTTTTISTCCISCSTSTCTSDTTYSAYGSAYERKATRSCNCSSGCVATYTYRCAAGYYGSPGGSASGCSRCPDGGTSAVGSTSVTSCYMPAGSTFSDTTGNGDYTDKCSYVDDGSTRPPLPPLPDITDPTPPTPPLPPLPDITQ
ncbi:hypothetical protein HDR63_01875 [bacterium]|nr:hypothetical protein [bacterium]